MLKLMEEAFKYIEWLLVQNDNIWILENDEGVHIIGNRKCSKWACSWALTLSYQVDWEVFML